MEAEQRKPEVVANAVDVAGGETDGTMDSAVKLRTKSRNKRPGLETLNRNTKTGTSTRTDRPPSHHAPPSGVHKKDEDSTGKRRSKGYDAPDDARSVASGTSNRPKHKDGYRKKDGDKNDGGKKRQSAIAEQGCPMELNDIKTNGEVAAAPSDVRMRANSRHQALTGKMLSYGNVSYRKSGYNVWTDNETQRASVKFTRELQKNARKQWQEMRHVTELTIDDEDQVYKAMPLQLCDLSNLTTLSFTLSAITCLPLRFSHLRLHHLTLRENSLRSVKPVAKITTLVTLDLCFNELRALPADIGALTKLKVLKVGKNKMSSLPASIGQLCGLCELTVNSNRLTKLPDSIGSLRELTSLDIGDNDLTSIPETIGKLEQLTELRASRNKLRALPASLEGLKSLQFLFLARNEFTKMPHVLKKMASLRVINMNQNHLADMTVPLRSVRSLMLDENNLDKFPEAILACESLEILSLQNNHISVIPDGIRRLRNLYSLLLASNDLSEVPEAVTHLTNLNHLTLNDTNIQRLPKSFNSLDHLKMLTLNKDKLDKALQEAYEQGIPGVMDYINDTQSQRM